MVLFFTSKSVLSPSQSCTFSMSLCVCACVHVSLSLSFVSVPQSVAISLSPPPHHPPTHPPLTCHSGGVKLCLPRKLPPPPLPPPPPLLPPPPPLLPLPPPSPALPFLTLISVHILISVTTIWRWGCAVVRSLESYCYPTDCCHLWLHLQDTWMTCFPTSCVTPERSSLTWTAWRTWGKSVTCGCQLTGKTGRGGGGIFSFVLWE